MSLFFLSNCKNPSGVGLDVDPGSAIYGQKETYDVQAVTLRDDSARNNANALQIAFGYLNDPVMGTTRSDLVFNIGHPETDPRIPDNAILDSAVLILPYGRAGVFGDSVNSNYVLELRRLAEVFSPGTFVAKNWSVEPEVIATATLSRFAVKDSISIVDRIDGKDSTIRVPPQFRLRLNDDFVRELLSHETDSATMADAGTFMTYVRGFHLSVKEEASTGMGSLVHFSIDDGVTGVELFYKVPADEEDEEATADTVARRFPMNRSYTSVAVKQNFSQVVLDALADPSPTPSAVFVKGFGGLRTRISIPALDELRNRKLAINKAQLVIYTNTAVTGNDFTQQAPRLTLYRQDIAGQRQPVPDGDTRMSSAQPIGDPRSLEYRSGFTGGFGGFYDSNQRRYIFNLTSFIQDLILNKIPYGDMYISPILPQETANVSYAPTVSTGSRAILAGPGHETNKMELVIYFTELD